MDPKLEDQETRLRFPDANQCNLLQTKNCLLNVLGEDGGGSIVVCGDTSVGKSTVINFLLGFPLNFESMGVGTRRPCVLSQVNDASCEVVQFHLRFEGKDIVTHDIQEVSKFVAEANKSAGSGFETTPIFVEMRHKDFLLGMRFVDLPGLVHPSREGADSVKNLAMGYLKAENTVVVVLGADNWTNGGTHLLCERIKKAKKVIIVQNFAYSELTRRAAMQRFTEVRETMGGDFEYVLFDVGPPGDDNQFKKIKKITLA